MLSIFLVERTDKIYYDEYRAFVCIAETIDEVKTMKFTMELTDLKDIVIKKIGTADKDAVKGVVLADFIAG